MLNLLLLAALPARAVSVQEDYNAAQAHLDARRLAEARAGFSALLARLGPQSASRSATIVRSRLAETLVELGEVEEAQPLLETALASLPAGNAALRGERGAALTHLARATEEQGQIRTALGYWQQILDEKLMAPASLGLLDAQAGVARTAIWSRPEVAAAMIETLITQPDAAWGASKAVANRGRLMALRLKGQLAMASGRLADAATALAAAGKLAGGTETSMVNIDDIELRGDLVTLAWLRKDSAALSKLTALSGANMLDDGSRGGGGSSSLLPPCTPTGTVAPDAMAVIEFGVGDDGRVLNVRPVYVTTGSGPADSHPEEAFVAAVHEWSWPAEQAKAVNLMWRAAIRVELRCLTRQPDLASDSLFREARDWFDKQKLPLPEVSGTDAQRRQALLASLASIEAAEGPQSPRLLGVLGALMGNTAVGPREAARLGERLASLAEARQAPILLVWLGRNAASGRRTLGSAERRKLIDLAETRGEGRLADYLRLQSVADDSGKQAEALLQAIIARRADGDPLRTQALLRLSDLAFARGDEAAAASALASTGLSPQQCSLVDVRPLGSSSNVFSSADFPVESLSWGLSSLMQVSYDIRPSGETTNVRVILARPPFVFSDAVVRRIQKWRFKPVMRGTETVGCVGRTQGVRFNGASG
ncbi:energy transducer TonB [Sandarakinorhabdus rubra]|uniref:energy transducer TonB n=1 Tax=Sandarakinorhabdus rubra TaxID=2672568 RepID=UPI0013DAA688|nr:energy transducer TonB [Sandarakinorhabdus rubra]